MHEIKPIISFDDFSKVDIRAGTIIDAKINVKAKKYAYVLRIDFGEAIGIKTTSAQITEGHALAELIGQQVLAVVNFPPKKVADVVSEVLVLGVVQPSKPTILLGTSKSVQNGAPVL
jgi:tRNA-binding protein